MSSRTLLISLGAGVSTLVATVVTALARRRTTGPTLPEPAGLAGTTASAVHNAAKGSLIAAVREARVANGDLVERAAFDAVVEAARAGADLTAAAIGVVEGADDVAHLLDGERPGCGARAAKGAVDAADAQGTAAGTRVRTLLAPILDA
ncbi:MAG: hypothetical protein WD225_08820 [Ilumatobacteraceae bacterium]